METKFNLAGVLLQVAMVVAQLSQVASDATPPRAEILKPVPLQPALILPGRIHHHVDGDTLDVVFEIRARVRVLECWAPELESKAYMKTAERLGVATPGVSSLEHLQRVAPLGAPCVVNVPIAEGNGLSDLFSFGRILGHVQVDGKDLATEQVRGGHATRRKP